MALSRMLWVAMVIALVIVQHTKQVISAPAWTTPVDDQEVPASEDISDTDTIITLSVDEPGQAVSLTLISPLDPFEIGSMGVFKLKSGQSLDFETTQEYNVTIHATGTVTTPVNFKVVVNDANDVAPVLNMINVDETLPEESAVGTTIPWDFTATDADTVGTLTYSLIGADASLFELDPASNNISLNTEIDIDAAGAASVYKPVLKVSDGVQSATATLTLTLTDINDNSPNCTRLVEFASVDEETSDTVNPLVTLACIDADQDSPNNVLEYTIVEGDTTKFDISDNTVGKIFVKAAIDYETPTTTEKLKIRVADKAASALSVTVSLIVTINPTNDNSPSWAAWSPALPSVSKTYSIDEDEPVGTTVFKMSATDADIDTGSSITYSIVSVQDNGGATVTNVFSVDPSTGNVTTLATLDRESVTQYTVNVKASDGTNDVTETVIVALNDVNDNSPVFSNTPYSVEVVAETNALTNSVVFTAAATDSDVTAATFTYEVEAVVSGSLTLSDWQFNSSTLGQLEFAQDIDLDTAGSTNIQVLRLIVKDGVATEKTGTATLTVSITDDNEFTPTIDSVDPAGTVPISESVAVGGSVAQVDASDGDVRNEGVLTYSILSGNTNGAFVIDSTGLLKTAATLDRETLDNYELVVKVLDTAKSATVSVSVTITDASDTAPTCNPYFFTKDISETAPDNTSVATITCTDADTSDSLTYEVKTHTAVFGFNSPDNDLKMIDSASLNYDSSTQSYEVTVDVHDGISTATVVVYVKLTPENDEGGPSFASNVTETVDEGTLKDPLTTYTGTDGDYSPHNIVSYDIQSVSNSGNSLFAIDSGSGIIRMLKALDYEALPTDDKTYQIEVVVEDGGGLKGTGTVTVSVSDVNDNAPDCTSTTYTKAMAETQGGSGPYPIVTLGCNDTEGTSLSYSITSGGAGFSVADDVVSLVADTLDYETATSHTIVVEVEDSGASVLTTTLTVYVSVTNLNDGGPTFGAQTAVDKDEDVAVGTAVALVAATDPDGDDPVFGDLQYSIISGDPSNQFTIDVDTGQIATRKALDFETVTVYNLTVKALERGGANSATVVLDVIINDKNDEVPTCNPSTLTQTVGEDETASFVVANFSLACTDGDADTTLDYSITTGDTTLFEISGSELLLKAQLDYETAQSHDLTIQVSDGTHTTTITGAVNVGSVDEGQPTFAAVANPVNVSETRAVGSEVVTLAATDPDTNLDANGQIKYSFASSYPDFVIDEASGKISVAKPLDRETTNSYTLIVRASDATGFDSTTVNIAVEDENDNTPVFSLAAYTGSVSEADPSGTTVVTVTANDADDPDTNDYGTVQYSISGTGSSNFAINASSGVITTAAVLDADGGTKSYTLEVFAKDNAGGASARTGEAVVLVTVTTDNQHDPVFDPSSYTESIGENEYTVGDTILTVTATDQDSGSDGDLTFEFVSAQSKFSLVQIADTKAELRLKAELNFEAGDTSFNFQIRAKDAGGTVRSALTDVIIYVNDTNDNNPLCTSSVINADVDENQSSITSLACSDADAGTTLAYSIVSTTPNSITPAVSSSGVVSVTTPLDYENEDAHTILVKVQDDTALPVLSTTVTIYLRISDLNDNDPSHTGSFAFTVDEDDTASNTVLYTAVASGNDGPEDVVTFSLDDTTYFAISADTGKITLKTDAPDFETVGDNYTMNVVAKDTANPTIRSASQLITVTVNDVNDNKPVFDPAVYTAQVAEDASLNDPVPAVTASDADTSVAFKTITYSIQGGNADGHWAIDPSSGAVEVAGSLDYETTTSYDLIIRASDGTLSSTVTYNILVTPVNDFDPAFGTASETVNVDEGTAIGTFISVAALPATDQDDGVGGNVYYTIDAGPLSINANNGSLRLSSELDRETTDTYVLKVRAIDDGVTPKTGTLALTLNVNDVNDVTPSCSSSVYIGQISETASGGETVATLVCVDDDATNPNNLLTYEIVSGDPSGLFEVDSAGKVTVASGASFDRETNASYTLVIDVTDKATTNNKTFSPEVQVTILDVNDNDPVFHDLPTNVPQDENIPVGTTVYTLNATDADSGVNAELVYAITSGNIGSKFFINSDTGAIVLKYALDFETTESYTLEVSATDKGSGPRSVTGEVMIDVGDVSDESPVCSTALYSGSVTENANSQVVAIIACTDPDDIDTPTYSVTGGDDGGDFEMIGGTLRSKSSASIDYESTTNFTITVTASDGTLSDTTQVKVLVLDVNEFDPAFTSSGVYTASMAENETAGYSVTQVAATDADTADTVKLFSITGGNTGNVFSIDAFSGEVFMVKGVDRETEDEYILNLQVEDSGGKTGAGTLTITITDINDNAPTCTSYTLVASVDENDAEVLSPPSCTDKDTVATPTLVYSITSGAHSVLSLNTGTGSLTINSPGFDYENLTSHQVTIEVSDQGTPTPLMAEVTMTITINPLNEHDPVFTPNGTYTPPDVSEDTVVGTSVAKVEATDDDAGVHGTVRYSIVGGDTQSQFSIDQSTGDIYTAKPLDRESTPSYTLNVKATDNEPGAATERTADATVTIVISDLNDNTPVFNPTTYITDVSETAAFGPTATLVTVTVTDADDGANAAITVSITNGNAEGKFAVSGKDIYLAAALDYETTTSYVLTVEAADGGSTPLKSVVYVSINVLPVNEMAPLMSESSSSLSLPETSAVGTLVYDANATDTDRDSQGTITYSIQSGVPSGEFIIDSTTGKLSVGKALDFDTPPTSYSIVLVATDGAGLSNASTSTVALAVALEDENDNYPQFASAMQTFDVDENSAHGTTVDTVVVTDDDSGVNGNLVYTKVAGNGFDYFAINSGSGEITTIDDIDYEAHETFYLTVKVNDGGNPSLTTTGLVKITVNNFNDNDPVITPVEFAIDVSEDDSPGKSILQYTGTDADTGLTGFSLDAASSFFAVSSTGEVTIKAGLDREHLNNHTLYIRLIDQQTSSDATKKTSTATLTINVGDINDNDPVIDPATYTKTLEEGVPLNTLVFQILATDADADENGQLTYELKDFKNVFHIDSYGNVLVARDLDREARASYGLTVIVSDQGSTPRSDEVTTTITISDINDNDPIPDPASYNFTLYENSNKYFSVGTITATDADAGANAALVYSFDSFSAGTMAHFEIDSTSGEIRVALREVMDRETQETYIAVVKISDGGTPVRTATADVQITLLDLNDNPPVFSGNPYTASVDENTLGSVMTPVVTDADIDENAFLIFSMDTALLDGPTANAFLQVNSATGEVSVTTAIDYESYQSFTFVMRVRDNGTVPLTATATVTVNINDLNDNAPFFNPVFYNTEVAFNLLCSATITTVSATDRDSGANAQISYSLVPGSNVALFSLDANTGAFSMAAAVPAYSKYTQDIKATDAGTSPLSSAPDAVVRVDTFDPNDVIVSFKLTITRAEFEAQQDTFLSQLQAVVRGTYSSALIRLWCVEEYTASSSGRRRLLNTDPVVVHTYSLQTDNTESSANTNVDKTYVDSGTLQNMVANADGTPNSALSGSQWDSFGIVSVDTYKEDRTLWWDTLYGPIITAIACLLGLVWLVLLCWMVFVLCCREKTPREARRPKPKPKARSSTVTPIDSSPEKPKPPAMLMGATGNVQDPLANTDPLPGRDLPPRYSAAENDYMYESTSRSSVVAPRNILISQNDEFNNGGRSFTGKAYDPVTGKMYEYNTRTNHRQWLD